VTTTLGEPNAVAIAFFLLSIALSFGVTVWAARRTRSTEQFYAAGRTVTARQNGLALAGDFMSAAAFLGNSGLIALSGFDGFIYCVGGIAGWPIVMVLVAEALRNLGKYTFVDVVAYRLRQRPVRIVAAFGSLTVILFYLTVQMVGAGNLIRVLFGLSYEAAVVIVGGVMLAAVLFGGMIATTWVQIIKAVLLLAGASALAGLALARFGFNPLALFAEAAGRYGNAVLAPGGLLSDPLDAMSLGLALMLGTAGLPHVLMRFYTVPDARTARVSVVYATGVIGFFYLLTYVLGYGAMAIVGREAIVSVDPGGNMAAPLLAEAVGGRAFMGFVSAVAFSTILAVVAGLTLSGAATLSHDLWVNVVRRGRAVQHEQLLVGRVASVAIALIAIAMGIAFKGQNVSYMVGLAFAVAASANFPALVLAIYWKGLTTNGAVASILAGTVVTVALIGLSPAIQVDVLHNASATFPLRNPAILTVPLSFLVAIIVSLLAPNPDEQERFQELQHRLHFASANSAVPVSHES
jgi:cation/acetate symporter